MLIHSPISICLAELFLKMQKIPPTIDLLITNPQFQGNAIYAPHHLSATDLSIYFYNIMDLPAQQCHQSDQSFEDDLQAFYECQQEQIVQNIMERKDYVKDDRDYIAAKNQPKVKQEQEKQKQLSQEERLARQMRLLNTRKYFEVIKTMYLQHIVTALNTFAAYKHSKQKIVAMWMSMLPSNLLQKYLKICSSKNLSINIVQLLSLLSQIKEYLVKQQGDQKFREQFGYNQLFWSICEELGLACRKVQFFAIDTMVEEVFFKLKYQATDKQRIRQNRKMKQKQMISIKLEQKMEENLQASQSQNYMFLEDFQFDQNSFKSKTSRKSEPLPLKSLNLIKNREQKFIRRKNYKDHYFQVFDPISQRWEFVNSEILEIESIEQFKNNILEGKFIVGFYSIRLLHFKKQYQQLARFRSFRDAILEDLTMYFCDNPKLIANRRKRIGLKQIMRQIFVKGGYDRNRFLLTHYDQHTMDVSDKLELEYQLSIFPNNKQQMLSNEFFIVPSMLPQYCILDPKAVPLQKQFNEQKVYLKRDLIAVTSRNGWVDKGRKVKQSQTPVKKTENKSKNMTELFLFEQTEPYSLSVDPETGDFIPDDEYNNIYVPPGFQPQQELTIINKKISFVCNKAKIKHVQLVQGFNRTVGRILPNYIGFLVYKKEAEEIERLQALRQAKIQQSRSKNREKKLIALWNKVFKKIELTEWSKSFQNK